MSIFQVLLTRFYNTNPTFNEMSIYLLDDDFFDFPPADHAEEDGLLAVGGDLTADRLINAYSSGIFPWYSDGEPIMW